MRPRSNRWLKHSYNIYNEKYFDNVLSPSVKVYFGNTADNHDAHWEPSTREIVVNKNLQTHDAVALICLLHEMAHAKLDLERYVGGTTTEDPHHGMRFQAELDRLYRVGAYDGLL